MTELDLLTKHVMSSTPKAANAIASLGTNAYEDDDYVQVLEEVSFNMCKPLKQPMAFKVVSVIDMIDDEVVNAMEIDFVSQLLVGVLWNFGCKEIEEYEVVVAFSKDLGS